jgi:hypothetical protein
VTGNRNIEEIRVDLCRTPISLSQEPAGVTLRIPACACLSRWQRRQVPAQAGSGTTESHVSDAGTCLSPGDARQDRDLG